eukprot:CAMPEP_0197233006 /NCGR_PEP_ID=MMETSP1429-20130617/1183_1 /TAXON_ID=49237 /ORGANISM="Chaetoceros  sp., Strain UNC1202" /LENGTH=177 /DNA_ID=CAMNT_0042691177 /DNA_START=95 /DNA_END=628 /DNA_ORIENTATION=+
MMKSYIEIKIFATLILLHAASAGLFAKKQYTPLIMFKVPKGTIEECDAMEKVVKSVEKELNTKVQRLDILKDRFARNLYEKIDEIEFRGKVPLLYHRESRQSIYGLDTKERVKAWAKGRWLSTKNISVDARGTKGEGADFVPDEDEQQQAEFMEEDLTELQQLGKEKMLERLEDEGR